MKKILIIVIVVIIAAGGAAFYFLRPKPVVDLSFNYDPGEYFVTDIKSSRRLLKTDIIIYSKDKTELKHFEENNHRIRNIVIFTLREKTESQLQSSKIQIDLSKELIEKLNREFKTESFTEVYFNEFVIQ